MYCILTDGERFIYRDYKGKYVPTRSEMMADHFTKKEAENVLKNHLPKASKIVFRIKKIGEEPISEDLIGIKPITKEDMERCEKVSENEKCNHWIERIRKCLCTKDEMKKRKEELQEEQSKIDREISVLLHYIEFGRYNAVQGWKVLNALRNRLKRRREIKNENEVVKIGLSTDFNTGKEDVLQNMITVLDNRTYSPKEMEELFDL